MKLPKKSLDVDYFLTNGFVALSVELLCRDGEMERGARGVLINQRYTKLSSPVMTKR
jgi:hypothetical protein